MKMKVTMEASDSTEVSSPMILTGYAALNKLLGKNVYSSQARPWAPDGPETRDDVLLQNDTGDLLHIFSIPWSH